MTNNPHLAVERITPQYWRVTFDHGPINTITAQTVEELSQLVGEIERDADLTVVVFTSSNREFFLAHYDTEGDPARTVSMPPGPTGMHPWLDLTARLSRAPCRTQWPAGRRDRSRRATRRVVRQAGDRGDQGVRRRDHPARRPRTAAGPERVLRLVGASGNAGPAEGPRLPRPRTG
ncbi:hypothetical protein AB0E63_38170 [Kribbella sp. NPDC026596]|uniref:hypothetical protein n=1 Tax=Kribbella sp. NPDC026596 TaxID=3155122 RepID=UPI0033DEB08D